MFELKRHMFFTVLILVLGLMGIPYVTQANDVVPRPTAKPSVEVLKRSLLSGTPPLTAVSNTVEGLAISDHAKNIMTPEKDHLAALKKFSKIRTNLSKRSLNLYNIHTKEHLNITFWVNGHYIAPAIKRLNWFMRDWRVNKATKMDPEVYSLLYILNKNVKGREAIHVISGHRTRKTNDALRRQGRNTAKKSQHVEGRAIDIMIPGVSIKKLRMEALKLKKGGVGYYPKSGFVHIDTGDVRQW